MANPNDLAQGTNATPVNPTNYNIVIDRINELGNKVIDIADYGAVAGAGVSAGVAAANSVAIQAAIVAGAADEVPVYIPAGVFVIDTTLIMDSNTHIFGGGWNSIIKLYGSGTSTIRMLTFTTNAAYVYEDVTLRDFQLDGNVANRTTKDSSYSAIQLFNCRNVLIENLKICDNMQGGVNVSYDNGSDQRNCRDVKIVNCTIDNVGIQSSRVPEGVMITGGEGILVQGCTIINSKGLYGINLETLTGLGARGIRLGDNYIENHASGGIQIQSNDLGQDNVEDIVISGNTINTANQGIEISTSGGAHVPENVIVSNNIVASGPTLSRGTTDTNVSTSAFGFDQLNETGFWVAANTVGTSLPAGNIPADTWAIYKVEIGADSVIDILVDNNTDAGFATEALAIAALPATSANHTAIGYFTVQADAAVEFIPGTDALEEGTSGNPAQSTRYYHLPVSSVSGITANNAIVDGNIVRGYTVGIKAYTGSVISSNFVDSCGRGIELYGATDIVPPYDSANMGYSVIGNKIYNVFTDYGIYLLHPTNVFRAIVANNLIEDNIPEPNMQYGIYMPYENIVSDVHLEGNRIYGYTKADIWMSGANIVNTRDDKTFQKSIVAKDLSACATLNGTSHYFNAGDVLDAGTNDISIGFWIKTEMDSALYYRNPISKFSFSDNIKGYGICIAGDEVTFLYNDGTLAVGAARHNSGIEINDGYWHHVAGTWDRGGNLDGYVDGVNVGSWAINATDIDNAYNLLMGYVSASYYLEASIQDMRIYIAAGDHWSAAEITAMFESRMDTSSGESLTSSWYFDDSPLATVIDDAQAAANDLTLVGGTTTNFYTHTKAGGTGLITVDNAGKVVTTKGALTVSGLDSTFNGDVEVQNDTPFVTLSNKTEEDAAGGRESSVLFKGEQSGGEKTTLAKIESSHSGAADDEKGQLKIYTNDGNDADAPTLAVTVDSVQCLSVVGDIAAAGGFRKPFPFMQIDVAANQAAVAIDVAGLAGNTEYMVPYAGSVIAITVASNDARTAGTLTVDATINGTVTGLQAVLDADPTTYAYTVQAKDLDALVAGDRLGVKITTDGDWAPITADILVTVEVEG